MSSAEQRESGAARARVLTVDDSRYFLGVMRDLIGATGHLRVAGEARSGEGAVQTARELRPEVVLMDVWMPGVGGLKAAAQIKAAFPSTLVILISTTHPDELPVRPSDRFADALIWKGLLEPKILDEMWLRHTVDGAR